MYSQAIAGAEGDATLFGNRSAAYLAAGLYQDAILDAQKAKALSPAWSKGFYRCPNSPRACHLIGMACPGGGHGATVFLVHTQSSIAAIGIPRLAAQSSGCDMGHDAFCLQAGRCAHGNGGVGGCGRGS